MVKLTIPTAPSGSYQPGATIDVHAAWASWTGSGVYVYLLNRRGDVVGGAPNPVQVKPDLPMNTTFPIGTPSDGAVYYVAVAPVDHAMPSITLDVTASLSFG